MLDSNEKVQSQVDTQTSGVTLEADNEGSELEKKELNKRALVEQEIREHPLFKSMQETLDGTQVKINIDEIVDRYFELSTEQNILDNKEFYQVNSDMILHSLQETAYIISKEENGIVLNDSGGIDKDATLRQQASATYSQVLKNELLEELEGTKKSNIDVVDTVFEVFDKDSSIAVEHQVAKDMLINYGHLELSSEEARQVAEKYLNNTVVQEVQEELKHSIFLDTKEDVYQLKYAWQFLELISNGAEQRDVNNVYQEIMNHNSNNRFNFGDNQSKNVDQIVSFAVNYGHRYSQRKSYKELANFAADGTDFEEKNAEDQRDILKSIYFLAEMTDGEEKEFAILSLKRISPGSLDFIDGKFQINKERFLSLYNATLPITQNKKNIEEVEADVTEKNNERLKNHIDNLMDKIAKGEFTEFRMPKGLSKEEEKEIRKQMQKEIHKAQLPQIDKNPEERLERAIDQFIKENKFEGDRAQLVIAAYKHISKAKTDKEERTSDTLRKHIQGLGSRYGNYFIKTGDGKNNGISSAKLSIEENDFDSVKKLADFIVDFQEKQEYIEQHKNSIEHIKEHLADVRYAVGQSAKAVIERGKGILKNIFGQTQKQLPPGQEEKINSILGKNRNKTEIGKAIDTFKRNLQLSKSNQKLKFKGRDIYAKSYRVKNMSNEKSIAKVEKKKLFDKSKKDIQVEKEPKTKKHMTFDEKYRVEQSIDGTNRVSKEFTEKQNRIENGEIAVADRTELDGEDIAYE